MLLTIKFTIFCYLGMYLLVVIYKEILKKNK